MARNKITIGLSLDEKQVETLKEKASAYKVSVSLFASLMMDYGLIKLRELEGHNAEAAGAQFTERGGK